MSKKIRLCYLCGAPLLRPVSSDHVPMRQLFSGAIRAVHSPNLLTIRTHQACNRAYQLDEEYFVYTFAPLALDSYSGASTIREIVARYHQGRNVPLASHVLAEFDERPSGLHLPSGLVLKRFDGRRVSRVLWKIVRGLFFHEYGRFLPLRTPRKTVLCSPGEKPPPAFFQLRRCPTQGKYPGVFDYKFRRFPELNMFHLWALLFWNRLIVLVGFHDPECTCEKCHLPHVPH